MTKSLGLRQLRRFSDREVSLLISMREKGEKRKTIGDRLGRSVRSIEAKLKQLGIKRKWEWSDEEKENIEKANRSPIAKKVMKSRLKKMKD